MSNVIEDIRAQWERGIPVTVIAKQYHCEVKDIMQVLGIWA
jgi:sulfite reductase alpha subunit-like flavoprotein